MNERENLVDGCACILYEREERINVETCYREKIRKFGIWDFF